MDKTMLAMIFAAGAAKDANVQLDAEVSLGDASSSSHGPGNLGLARSSSRELK
jgi:hypothetical protein